MKGKGVSGRRGDCNSPRPGEQENLMRGLLHLRTGLSHPQIRRTFPLSRARNHNCLAQIHCPQATVPQPAGRNAQRESRRVFFVCDLVQVWSGEPPWFFDLETFLRVRTELSIVSGARKQVLGECSPAGPFPKSHGRPPAGAAEALPSGER